MIVQNFLSLDILDQDQSFCSDVCSNLSQQIFENENEKDKKWLHCLWTYYRRDIRGKVKAHSCISKGPELPTDGNLYIPLCYSEQERVNKLEEVRGGKKRHSKKDVLFQDTDQDSAESPREMVEEQDTEDSDSPVSPKSGRSDAFIRDPESALKEGLSGVNKRHSKKKAVVLQYRDDDSEGCQSEIAVQCPLKVADPMFLLVIQCQRR